MHKPVDKKGSQRAHRQARLAQQLRGNLLKRKAQARGRAPASSGGEVRPAGNRPQDS
jgi:hypothetical protein